jgi:uncharacterized membrane protein YphA (DoxX/SURF4 family)
MENRRALSNLGIYVYGLSGMVLGVVGFVWSDFATDWQHVQASVPHRAKLAYIAVVYEIVGGGAILWHRTARVGAVMLAVLYSVFALLWVPQIIGSPLVYDVWGNFFEEFSLVIAAVLIYTEFAPPYSRLAGRAAQISRLYGICVISFALEHLFYLSGRPALFPSGFRLDKCSGR